MFCGIDFMGLDSYNENMNCVNNIYSVQIKDCIVDEIEIKGKTDDLYSITKEIWQYTGILLARFQDNLSAGNIDNGENKILSLLFKKRKTGSLEWSNVTTVDYDDSIHTYEFIDKFIQANQPYDIALIPVATGGIKGTYITKSITPDFEGSFLFDNDTNIHFKYDIQADSITNNRSMGKYEPLGSKYPIIAFGSTNYKSSKLTSTILSANTENHLGNAPNGIDLLQERLNMDAIIDFIDNAKIKIIKDGQGKFYLVTTTNCIETPNNNLSQMIGTVSFDWIQVGDSKVLSDLTNVGLGNVVVNS